MKHTKTDEEARTANLADQHAIIRCLLDSRGNPQLHRQQTGRELDDDLFTLWKLHNALAEASVTIKLSDLLGLLAEADEALGGDSNDAEHDALFSLRTSIASWAGAPDRGTDDEKDEGQHEKTYTFEQHFVTTLKVRGRSEGHAAVLLRNRVHGVTANFGSWPDGEPILGAVSLVGESDLADVTREE